MPVFHRPSRLLVAAILLLPLTSISSGAMARGGLTPPAARGSSPGIVEEVRDVRVGHYIVEHRILIDTRVAHDPAAVADRIAGASASGGNVTAQYVVDAWKWPASAMPIAVHYNPSPEAPRPSIQGPIESAIDEWSSVTPSTFRFVYAGTTTAGTGACDGAGVPDGINTIAYVTTLPAGTLGQTCTLRGGDNSTTLFEFDMQLNWTIDWSAAPVIQPQQYDLYSTVLHEMGHAAGLAHPCILGSSSCTASDRAAVMYASLLNGVEKRVLTPDDMDGLRALYPGGPPPLPSPPPFTRLYSAVLPEIIRAAD